MTIFSLANKSLKLDSAEDIKPYLDELMAIEGLTQIDLSGNTYGVEACKALAAAITDKQTLKVANLADAFTGRLKDEIPEALEALFPAMLTCKNLHTINLSDNALGLAAVDPLESFLSKHTPLQHLILANNGFGPFAGARIGKALEDLAAAKKAENVEAKLETVVCGRNRLENGSMEAWAKFVAAHGTLKEIRLYQNGIRQEGVEHFLTEGLPACTNLERLDMQDNTFTVVGSRALAKVIGNWSNLKELNVSDCLLSARGGELLGQALIDAGESINSVQILRLQYNEIELRGLELIKKGVELNIPALELLELNGNRFPEDHEFIDALTELFEERGVGELDDLDDMEEESSDEEESDEEDEEDDKEIDELATKITKDL
ncbi:RNI-like protein [Nadsonia fulvescens var. elongata DSM 6958]|uniref:RNI-like protein n=1 Tax=Nadsonia fulvescens var. elongata DSM 6958 TaxID=857566 RepID=A0A1E3PK16_9ASCO|nr:RNI-like protein [Nadsonia fulvescens var. elongata DSM 6958]